MRSELSGRAQGKDAFVALLKPMQRPLEVYCRRMLRNPAWAEDVLQAAVAEAYAHFDRFTEGSNFRAWMFRFVTHAVCNRNRKHEPVLWDGASLEVPVGHADGPDAEEVFAALLHHPDEVPEYLEGPLAEALGRLPPLERAVLRLRAVGGLSYREIHELLSIPLGSVMGYLSRARLKLRRSLADYAARRGLAPRGRPPRAKERNHDGRGTSEAGVPEGTGGRPGGAGLAEARLVRRLRPGAPRPPGKG